MLIELYFAPLTFVLFVGISEEGGKCERHLLVLHASTTELLLLNYLDDCLGETEMLLDGVTDKKGSWHLYMKPTFKGYMLLVIKLH